MSKYELTESQTRYQPGSNGGRAGHRAGHHGFGHRLIGFAWTFDFHAERPVESVNCTNYNLLNLLQQDIRLPYSGVAAIFSNGFR